MMKKSSKIVLAAMAVGMIYGGGVILANPPNVSNVTLTQPTGTRVAVVEYTIDAPGIATFQFMTNGVDISHSEIVRTVTGDISKYIDTAGTYTFTWDAKRDYPEQVVSNLTVEVTLWATDNPPTYCAVNLVGSAYQVFWYGKESEVPFGVNDSWWKKDWLLLRQIPSTQGQFVTLGSPVGELGRDATREVQRNVRITKPFYMGVFTVTQRQYQQVMGTRPSYFSNSDVYEERPVDQVSFDTFRGAGSSYNWPNSGHAVLATSFLGLLRSRTGNILEFDLPTEAQWEYACRAGTTGAWNNGTTSASASDVSDANLGLLGRYKWSGGQIYNGSTWENPPQDCTDENGTAKVGSYLPNAWGLYDMHGNLVECCLDWYNVDGGLPSLAGDDPVGPTSGSARVARGGAWSSLATECRSARRTSGPPGTPASGRGFRISAPAEVFIAP